MLKELLGKTFIALVFIVACAVAINYDRKDLPILKVEEAQPLSPEQQRELVRYDCSHGESGMAGVCGAYDYAVQNNPPMAEMLLAENYYLQIHQSRLDAIK